MVKCKNGHEHLSIVAAAACSMDSDDPGIGAPAPTEKPKFWMVWSPRGKAPSAKHQSYGRADQEATRLSKKFPGRHFYILEMIGARIEGPEIPNKKEMARAADPAKRFE